MFKFWGEIKKEMSNIVKKDFIKYFKKQIPNGDKKLVNKDVLDTLIGNFFDWSNKRKKYHHKIRVFNTNKKRDGWQTNSTVIEIVNDDMPFLIDSISAELARNNFSIQFLFHPIIAISRDKKGNIVKVSDDIEEARLEGSVESNIHIQLEQYLTDEICKLLQECLSKIVLDVCVATGDWHAMLANLRSVIREVSQPTNKAIKNEDNEEAVDFLDYIYNNNFTLLGYRKYKFIENSGSVEYKLVKNSELGLLKGGRHVLDKDMLEREYNMLLKNPSPVIVNKWIDQYSTVHRRVPFDVINVKIFDKEGKLAGQHIFVGLFTSSTYSCRTLDVPIVRQKVRKTLARAKFGHDSHDRKALEHILEKYPRDELFQLSIDELVKISRGILQLQERQRIAVFTRKDLLERYISCLVYVPRDVYDTRFRKNVEHILEKRLKGVCTNFYTTLDDSPLARILFTVLVKPESLKKINIKQIEKEIIEVGRSWPEKLSNALIDEYGKRKGAEYSHDYSEAFPVSYQDVFGINGAIKDIVQIQKLREDREKDIVVDFFQPSSASGKDEYHLKVYHKGLPVCLSDILTVLDHMGLESISEMPFEIRVGCMSEKPIWVHDFLLRSNGRINFNLVDIKENFEKAFLRIWEGLAEDDELNALILQAGLTWREVLIVRSYTKYLKQARFAYTDRYIETVLSSYPAIVCSLIALYHARFNPKTKKADREKLISKYNKEIEKQLSNVAILDHDRILRAYWTLIDNTLRTNYYQTNSDGSRRACLAFKLDSKNIELVPKPRPFVEIFVYSSRLEAVHLRGGKIARGGIRWSDRQDDFRTEILGLVKSQMVKNAVIVPVGAKGGFILKNPPKEGGREAFLKEGIECYKIFIQSLLDLTDNNLKGKIIPPKNTVCYDEPDPYLVVAADKGTATFSDIANELSQKAGFWLDDAFASGGSAGYDHKAMGITAKGAWESVKRHFREIGKNIQGEDFTVIGVGDMGGDVFGNGMLLSEHIRLVGAFNHLHIFCDPNPDAATSFKERKRLFDICGGWDKYDSKKLSKGGRIYERSDKSLELTPEIKEAFGIDKNKVTPNELIRAMLVANVELLWFGGIGTYIKHSAETNADADDKANDNLRVDARDIRAKVIGEGANLGMTQKGRIEFASNGGRLNTDFIDNSAGVDCSDHEVNIKILLGSVEQSSKYKMTRKARNTLLEKMTDEVAKLVLKDNYQQTQALSVALSRASVQLPLYAGLIRDFEVAGILDRKIENLPSQEDIGRMLQDRKGLTRPEIATIQSYVKIKLFEDILESDLPDDKYIADNWLFEYFPEPIRKYKDEILEHKLKREIIATLVANTVVNRMGSVFIKSRMDKTGRSSVDVVKAFLIMSEAFDINEMWKSIEATDVKVSSEYQIKAFNDIYTMLKYTITWRLRGKEPIVNLQEEIEKLNNGINDLSIIIRDLIPHYIRDKAAERQARYEEAGMPQALANNVAYIPIMDTIPDIIGIGCKCDANLHATAEVYFGVGQYLKLGWLRQQCSVVKTDSHWEARVISGLVDDFFAYQASITRSIVTEFGCPTEKSKLLDKWKEKNKDLLDHIEKLVSDIDRSPVINVAMLVLASQAMRQFEA